MDLIPLPKPKFLLEILYAIGLLYSWTTFFNLGSVYETVVAQELNAHGFKMNYYDNKSIGEVDYLIDDYKNLTVLPLEVKSGKDYEIHRALDRFLSIKDYGITDAVVLCNEREIIRDGGITYMPVYYCMFYKLYFAETETIIPSMPIPGSITELQSPLQK